jgi:ATP-dependent DNA helicase DinG
VIDFLRIFYKKVQGRTLTLLTSFSSIKSIYLWLNADLKKEWIHLYPQSILWSKSKLMNMFLRNSSNGILLWTDSFWEWIDIPGEDLKFLVIHKFPFLVPTDPIFQARSIFFQDPFLEYSMPKAIIKLKQWFWRLIRTKTDTGVVILLDDRIYSTMWWKAFFNAFPSDIDIQVTTSKSIFNYIP